MTKYPTRRERAEERGCDELMNRVEYTLQDRPLALQNARRLYSDTCLKLYEYLERHFRWRERRGP